MLLTNSGFGVHPLSIDHKPGEPREKKRIKAGGGVVFEVPHSGTERFYRVKPGLLAVSRTIGDVEAKCVDYEGMPYVISEEPEVFTYKIEKEFDFIVLASILVL